MERFRVKTLTLTQPYASLIVWGEKWLETRSWSTTYRSPLAIHAAKAIPGDLMERMKDECLDARGWFWAAFQRNFIAYPTALPRGAVIGTVQLVDCVPVERVHVVGDDGIVLSTTRSGDYLSNLQDEAFGDFSPGRFAWVLEQPVRFAEPIPARGALGLWDWQPPQDLEGVA